MASVDSLGLHEPAALHFAVAENLLPPNPSPDLYDWELYFDENGDDELLTTKTCIIWSRGGEVSRCLRFDMEKEPILKALLAYFPNGEDKPDKSSIGQAGAKPRQKAGPAKSLIVFLRTQAHVYSFSGGEYVVHMPFEVETAIPAPRGVVIQRKSKIDNTVPVTLNFPRVPPSSFVASQILPASSQAAAAQTFSTVGLGKPKPLPLRLSSTLDTMWDMPLETTEGGWPRLVCLTDPMQELGLVVAQPEKTARENSSRSQKTSFLDPAEEILHVESVAYGSKFSKDSHGDNDLTLAVTVNRETSTYTVWRMTYVDSGDRFTSHKRQPKTKASRRRSSMQPSATTPHHASFRESLGGTLPVKKTRRNDKATGEDKYLEQAFSVESDKEASRRQSRRVSSRLARADLSASHDRPLFADQSFMPPAGGRRAESQGSTRRRVSFGYSAAAANNNNNNRNSLLDAPLDGFLEELGAFDNMGLEDPEFDGLAKEMLFTKIRSVPMDTANIRYSLSKTPASKMAKVFLVVGTPYSVDEQDRNYLLVCIQDTIDKRLQLLTLHVQMRKNKKASPEGWTTSVTWGQRRRAQNVADSCKIGDGDQAMILILSEGNDGQRQLSIQSPWSELTTVTVPPLSLHNRNLYASADSAHIFQTPQAATVDCQIKGLCFPRDRGMVDVRDENGRFHQLQIHMRPKSARVRQILNVLRSIFPASHAEKIMAGWWHIVQWLQTQPGSDAGDLEWTGLVVELCVLYLPLLHPEGLVFDASHAEAHGTGVVETTSPLAGVTATEPWASSKAWEWAFDDADAPTTSLLAGGTGDVLSKAAGLAKAYVASPAGAQAIGPSGYLPTATGLSDAARKGSAWGIAMALHLLLEEEKLDIVASGGDSITSQDLKSVVLQLCRWLRWQQFVERYELDVDESLLLSRRDPNPEVDLSLLPEQGHVPCIFDWITSRLTGRSAESFPSLGDVYAVLAQQNQRDSVRGDQRWEAITPRTYMFRRFFALSQPNDSSVKVVETMHQCGFTMHILNSLPEGMTVPFRDAISRCQQQPPSYWSHELYELVGRGDINTILNADSYAFRGANNLWMKQQEPRYTSRDAEAMQEDANAQAADEPESQLRQAVIQALFREDKRLYEAQSLLSSSKRRVVRLDPQPNWSESEYLEHQKELATTVATSTLATPAGRGMLNYGFRFPLLTQKFNVQGFNLNCIVKPANVPVGVDKSLFTEERVNWAFFHQGVAYGLAISAQAKGIDTSWIVFNKPGTDLSHRHAGFLLALGLNGHLKSVAKWVAFKYLTPKHMMTSIGLLLGLAVSHIGTMDSLITRLLSVHVTRMLPRGAAELNLSHQIQTTGVMGIGLLYYNSQHRRMSETMMSEIEFVQDEDDEDPLRNEGYRLAAGFALGLINLGKGSDRKGLLDMQITEQLLGLASSAKQVELVNVLDRSAAAATVAIALIFLKTEDPIVARKIDIPDSVLQFDYVRPDILLLRTLAKHLILWSRVAGTPEWIRASLPAEYRGRYRLDDVRSLRSVDLPLFAIVAGLCFAAALRFAGSTNWRVRDVLVHYLDRFLQIVQELPATTFDAQTARSGARMCLDVLALSCATVMAGTGDLVVLRRLRALHGRDDVHTTYGSHFAAHQAIGALFLGSGTTTFGNSNLAVAALLAAFYPIYPSTIQDNSSHLQAFRHFWVLATEPRCLVTKDAETGQPISVPIMVHLKTTALAISAASGSSASAETVLRRQTPCLLPPLDDILLVRTDASVQGFWDLEVNFERTPSLRKAFETNQNLHLRRRPNYESAFATTLQALGGGSSASDGMQAHADGSALSVSSSRGQEPLEWVFGLERFQNISLAERASILGRPGMTGGGSHRALSSATDARLVLEGRLDRWSRDSLLDLRLLFDWANNRDRLRDRGPTKDKPDDTAKPDWWMDDSAVDMLKGQAWMAGQED